VLFVVVVVCCLLFVVVVACCCLVCSNEENGLCVFPKVVGLELLTNNVVTIYLF
jgi:hypothetical protein